MRRALCVGVDQYGFGSLNGCSNDAKRMQHVLEKNEDGSPNFECRLLIAPKGGPGNTVTRSVLRENLQQLFKDDADVAVFHFSGHGTVTNLDGYLVTQDATSYDEGVAMTDVLKFANDSRAREVVILLDCCHSGLAGNLAAVDNSKTILREGISVLTAGRGDQLSVESGGGGVFTSLVIDALEGGGANLLGAVSAPAVYACVEAALGAWDQRPMFKSHISCVVELRRCAPPIDREILRQLPTLFPLPAEDFPLDPSFEPKSPTATPENVSKFRELQALNRVYLVVPIGVAHMYEAAMNSGGCRLTPTGRYYWRLAMSGRI